MSEVNTGLIFAMIATFSENFLLSKQSEMTDYGFMLITGLVPYELCN